MSTHSGTWLDIYWGGPFVNPYTPTTVNAGNYDYLQASVMAGQFNKSYGLNTNAIAGANALFASTWGTDPTGRIFTSDQSANPCDTINTGSGSCGEYTGFDGISGRPNAPLGQIAATHAGLYVDQVRSGLIAGIPGGIKPDFNRMRLFNGRFSNA
jgi:hypothetical protein